MSRYQTADEALAELEKRVAGLDWQNNEADRQKMQEAIRDVVNNTSVEAEGIVTIFYSGEVNGVDSFKIAQEMSKIPGVRILDKTEAFALLSDRNFQDIQARAFGYEIYSEMIDALDKRAGGDLNKYYGSPEMVFENDGLTGLWASISKRFAAETKGHVMLVTVDPRTNSVLILTEMPEMLREGSGVTHIHGEDIKNIMSTDDPSASAVGISAKNAIETNVTTEMDSIIRWFKSNTALDVTVIYTDKGEIESFLLEEKNNLAGVDLSWAETINHDSRFIKERINGVPVDREHMNDFLHRFANKKINDHHSLTESIRESITAITSHPTVAQAIDTIRNNSNPNLPVQVRARQLANESIDNLLQDGGSLSRHARQLRTDIEELTGVQESMGRMNEYQKAILSQSASLRNDAEILAGISSKTSGIDAFENRANPIKIDDKLAVNARAMSTSTNSGPAPLSGSHSRMS